MNIKDLLVYMDDAVDSRVQLEAGLWLAERCQAHMSVVYAPTEQIFHYGSNIVDINVIEAQLVALKKQGLEAKALFQTVTYNSTASIDYQPYGSDPISVLNRHSAYFDLLVVGQSGDRSLISSQASAVDHLLLGSGCPLLVVPQQETPLSIGDRVLIAWNGMREAAHALHGALPFLLKAKQVDIVIVASANEMESQHDDASRLVTHLARYGVTANVTQLPKHDGEEPAQAILSEAETREVNLIVMGAYGHSRLREIIIGGATRYMLEHSTIPLLMSH
ncbi:MAG: universal stress protein [Pseudomonadota bacterium]